MVLNIFFCILIVRLNFRPFHLNWSIGLNFGLWNSADIVITLKLLLLFLLHSKSHLLCFIERFTRLRFRIVIICGAVALVGVDTWLLVTADDWISYFGLDALELFHFPFRRLWLICLLLQLLLVFKLLLTHRNYIFFVEISFLLLFFISWKNVGHLIWVFVVFCPSLIHYV